MRPTWITMADDLVREMCWVDHAGPGPDEPRDTTPAVEEDSDVDLPLVG